MEKEQFVEFFLKNIPSLTPYFSSSLEVEKDGFMYHVVMKIYHKKSDVVIVKNEDLFASESEYTKAFAEFLEEYFHDVEIACFVNLRKIRMKPLEVHNETYLQACDEFLLKLRGGY